jgi:hypothetical protein
MISLARKEAARRGLDVEFHAADVRGYPAEPATFGGIFFTYDVYSFLPRKDERIALLRKMRSWLRPGGRVFLSARRSQSAYTSLIFALQGLAARRRGAGGAWGDSHTRWIAEDGAMRRSFVHVFSDRRLRAEIAAGGFALLSWHGGHGTLAAAAAIIDG